MGLHLMAYVPSTAVGSQDEGAYGGAYGVSSQSVLSDRVWFGDLFAVL